MPRSFDVAVLGGGIVGASCANEFARAGFRVALVEPSVVGGGATAAGMGHLAVMDDSEAQFVLTRYSQLLWQSLAERLPSDTEYLACGAIWVAADDEEMTEVHRKHAFYSARDTPTEVLDAESLAEAEPNLRAGLAGGLLVKQDAVVYPPCVARFLVQEAERHSLQVFAGRRAVSLHEHGVQLDDASFLSAGLTVVANGSAATSLIPDLEIKPRKGHLLITDRHPGFVRHQLIELGYLKSAHAMDSESVAFNVQPRLTGQLLIGSSRQFGTEETAIEAGVLKKMLRRAIEYMPGLAGLSAIRGWTGFRAATPDKLPLIGVCPGFQNVYLATGHEGLGITTAMGTARLLLDMVQQQPSAIDRDWYAPQRMYALHS